MIVLIITKSDDNECITSVSQAIEHRGGRAFRFDTDLFPTKVQAVLQQDDGADRLTLTSPAEQLSLSDVTAVWYRRTRFGGGISGSMDRQFRTASIGECRLR